MYKSPIDIILGEFDLKIEDGICKAVREVGIVVDKDELLKALKYDRDQYDKGFKDALAAAPVVHGQWIDNGIPESMLSKCSVCGFGLGAYTFQFCPKCGAKMDADHIPDNADRCVCCGDVIPEGRQVCPKCEGGYGIENNP